MKSKGKFDVQLTPELLARAEAKMLYWEREGQLMPGVHEQTGLEPQDPDWMDKERLQQAQKVAKDLFLRCVSASVRCEPKRFN